MDPDRPTVQFCPRCGGEGNPAGPLCPSCGEILIDRGYCPICEAHLKRPIGDLCPKHDVGLEATPPPPGPLARPGQRARLVTVATFSHPNQANAPRIRLEAEGIPTFLDGERVAGSTLYQVATGGVRLQVPDEHGPAARILMAQTWTPPVDPDDDLDDAWDDLGPEPGTRRRAVMKAAIIVILFGPVIIALATALGDLARSWLG